MSFMTPRYLYWKCPVCNKMSRVQFDKLNTNIAIGGKNIYKTIVPKLYARFECGHKEPYKDYTLSVDGRLLEVKFL